MDISTKSTTTTPRKDTHGSRSKNQESPKYAENLNPNATLSHNHSTPVSKSMCSSSPVVNKSRSNTKNLKSPSKVTNPVLQSPQNKIRQRKFLVAKKNPKKKKEEEGGVGLKVSSCKCKENNKSKCLCVAYENLRKSQEEFFKNQQQQLEVSGEVDDDGVAENEKVIQVEQEEYDSSALNEVGNGDDPIMMKRRRDRLVEEVRKSAPHSGSGKVLNLVKAFEKLLSEPSLKDVVLKEEKEEEPQENKKVMKWPLPGLQLNTQSETGDFGSSFCPQNLILTSENLGLDPRASVSSSWDSTRGRFDN